VGKTGRHDIERLINLAAPIASQRLSGKIRAAAHFQGVSPAELSLSLLGELFATGGGRESLIKHLMPILNQDDYSLFMRFKAVIVKTAAQGLFHRWKENDPTSARLRKNFGYALKSLTGVCLFPQDRPEIIISSRKLDDNRELEMLEQPELMQIAIETIRPEMSMPEIIGNILRCIEDKYPDIPRAVSVDLLFSTINEIRLKLSAELWEISRNAENHESPFDIAVEKARESAHSWIDARVSDYIGKGKLSPEAGDKYRLALEEILTDCLDGGAVLSYYEYLSLAWPDLTSAEYQENHRTRMEYLAKNLQEYFYDFIRKFI